jgi:hypothetical protein
MCFYIIKSKYSLILWVFVRNNLYLVELGLARVDLKLRLELKEKKRNRLQLANWEIFLNRIYLNLIWWNCKVG